MPNNAKLTRRTALALIAGGSGILISDTMGFTQINTDRGVSVDTASDENALLGLVDQSEGAMVSGTNDMTAVYDITDNTGSFSIQDFDVTVLKLINENGVATTAPPVQATVSGNGDQYTVDISCSSDTTSLGDSYLVVLEFDAKTDDTSITATRTTNSYVSITCTHDYGDSGNYRDSNNGGAAQPDDPSGNIENPSAVNKNDNTTSTAISSGGQDDLKVGYSLPPVNASANTYEMNFDIARIQVGNGTFGFYLVNSGGEELTDRQVLTTGDKTYSLSGAEEQKIAANHDDLYLIIDSNTTGKGNKELKIDYFALTSS